MSERVPIPDENIEIVMLAESHTDIIRIFDSDSKELNEYLAEEALRDQNVYISKTFLFMNIPNRELAGYVTLLTDSIKIKGTIIHEQFLEKGIGYNWMPALKIGRLWRPSNNYFKNQEMMAKDSVFINLALFCTKI